MSSEVLTETLALDPIPLTVRRQRVANGSKRKRDLAAVRMAEELGVLERVGQADAAVTAHWSEALDKLRASVPESTFICWLEPLKPAGADASTLFLTAPNDVRCWAERRYSSLIREALAGTGYTDVQFVADFEQEGATCR